PYPRYSRSSPYPPDVAKMIEAPIFHVHGDDPEAVVYPPKVATDLRQKLQKPVVIDTFCYRRFRHNRGHEPPCPAALLRTAARALASSALVLDGHGVAVAGQDSERGTFSSRHAVLIDQESEARHTPFNHLAEKQGKYEVLNSMLSEEAVLGYEYGYTLSEPN